MSAITPVSVSESSHNKPLPSIRLFDYWKDDIRCVFERDPAARNRLEVFHR